VADSWRVLGENGLSFFAYALSLLVISRFWTGHHQRFRTLRHFGERLMGPNMLYLMAIAFMPFATAFLGRNLGHFVPEIFYNVSMLVLPLLAYWLARAVRRATGPAGPPADGFDIVLASLVCIGLTYVVPLLRQWGMCTALLWTRIEKGFYSRRAVRAEAAA
jgi:uncharacterized membrane protein